MNEVQINQIVMDNRNYITCESGIFDDFDFVLCKRIIGESQDNSCAFLAISVVGSQAN